MTSADPVRLRSLVSGQANVLLSGPRLRVGTGQTLLLNPGVGRWDWLTRRGPQQRYCQRQEVTTEDGRTIVVAHLHASHDRETSPAEIDRAAALVADSEATIFIGDFNAREHPVGGYSTPIPGVDQILVRGLELEQRPVGVAEGAPAGRRRAALGPRAGRSRGGRVNLEQIRAELPVLEHTAYLNAGTFGPLPTKAAEAQVLWSLRALAEGRSGHAFFEEVLDMRVRLREAVAALIGGDPAGIALTTSTTEGCNTVVSGMRLKPGDVVVTTDSEHPGLIGALKAWGLELQNRRGVARSPAAEAIDADRASDRRRHEADRALARPVDDRTGDPGRAARAGTGSPCSSTARSRRARSRSTSGRSAATSTRCRARSGSAGRTRPARSTCGRSCAPGSR